MNYSLKTKSTKTIKSFFMHWIFIVCLVGVNSIQAQLFNPKIDYATGLTPISVVIGDLNGDGRPDLAVANRNSNTVSVLTSTGSGTFGAKIDYATGSGPVSVVIGDLNGDGRPDLALANYNSNTVSVLTITGSGTFGAKIDYATGSFPQFVAIGDLNGDGKPDLAVSNIINDLYKFV